MELFKNKTLKQKAFLMNSFIFAFLVFFCVSLIYNFSNSKKANRDIEKANQLVIAYKNLEYGLLNQKHILMEMISTNSIEEAELEFRNFSETNAKINQYIVEINGLISDKSWGNSFQQLKNKINFSLAKSVNIYKHETSPYFKKIYNEVVEKTTTLKQHFNTDSIIKEMYESETQFDILINIVLTNLDTTKKISYSIQVNALENQKSTQNKSFLLLILIVISCISTLIFLSIFIIRTIYSILGEDPKVIQSYLDKVSRGNVNFEIKETNKLDESSILSSIFRMIDSLKTKVDFANKIGQGEINDGIILTSKNDELGLALNQMSKNLNFKTEQITSLLTFQKSILDSTEQGIISTDKDGLITNFNRGAENMLGYGSDEIVGIYSPALFHDITEIVKKAEELSIELERKIEPGFEVFIIKAILFGLDTNEWTYIKKDGTKFTVELTVKPIFNSEGVIIGYTGVAKNITEDKKKIEEILKLKEKAENLAKTKDEFMSSMSHEIRTPLNGILGFTNILLNDLTIGAEQKKQLETIKTSGDILLVIINDILDIAKIEAGKMSLESNDIDLVNLTQHIFDTFQVKIDEKEIVTTTNIEDNFPTILKGDSIRISQILLNFISNAVKFTPHQGKISISLSVLNENEFTYFVEISVQDSGIGIPSDKLSSVFEPFVQTSDDTARKYGGTGLGLTIVKKIIDLMHGEVTVESEFGSGSKFTIILPLQKGNSLNSLNSLNNKINLNTSIQNIRILLAEDNLINQLLAQTILGQFEAIVTTVENGKLAVEAVKESDFDIVLMDLMMPEMDGYEAAQTIRNLENNEKNSIPIIAITADVTNQVMEKCKKHGMDEYMSKPFDAAELKTKILTLINKNV